MIHYLLRGNCAKPVPGQFAMSGNCEACQSVGRNVSTKQRSHITDTHDVRTAAALAATSAQYKKFRRSSRPQPEVLRERVLHRARPLWIQKLALSD